jgi:hypothetical protein
MDTPTNRNEVSGDKVNDLVNSYKGLTDVQRVQKVWTHGQSFVWWDCTLPYLASLATRLNWLIR